MFLREYLNDVYFELLLDTYDINYLETLDEDNFIKIYNLFKKYNFYFIEDIILKYLGIFALDLDKVSGEILNLKKMLGEKFVYLIGDDMRYLEIILNNASI